MSNYWIYSTEAMPRTDLFGKQGYNPSWEYIGFNGIYLEPVPAKTWVQIPDRFKSLRHHDRTDKQGHTYHVFADEIVKANKERMLPRGVIFLDHEPSTAERKELEDKSATLNMQFRMEAIQWFEDQVREHDTGNPARTKPTVYELECYEVLGVERPGSVAAFKSQRQPGEAVADRIVAALEKLLLNRPDAKPPVEKHAIAK